MKYLPNIAGGLLGLMFVAFSVMFFTAPTPPPPPPGTPMAGFMEAFGPTGYMTFVKILEIVGGVLVAFPKTRNFGLLVLGPIIINILAAHVFIMKDNIFAQPILIVISLLAVYLLWAGRKAFAGLIR